MRRAPEDLVTSIMETLNPEPQNINEIAKKVGCAWVTAWKYLQLIEYVQLCPPVRKMSGGKRIEIWSRAEGDLPE